MTEQEKSVIRCAYADLLGAVQRARLKKRAEVGPILQTLKEMEEVFAFLDVVTQGEEK